MNQTQRVMLEILKSEVRPAMGCTEPVAVVLAAAKAREMLGVEELDFIDVKVSPNFYKNGLSVGIPQTDQVGLDMASAIGAAGGDSSLGLEILSSVDEEAISLAKSYVGHGSVRVSIAETDEKVFVDVTLKADGREAQAIISGHHDRFVSLRKDSEIETFEHESAGSEKMDTQAFFNLSIAEIVREIENVPYDEIKSLKDGVTMNLEMAHSGLEKPLGMGVGYAVKRQIEDGVLAGSLQNHAMMLTAAASDARMSGLNKPVMSSNGSGNNGLTAILPIAAYAELNEIDDDKLVRALAMSHLINCYMKHFIGRLSAICSCAVSAATGSGAALTWLMGGGVEAVENTIQNMIGNLSGLICDGAKDSCALKLATAASTGVQMSSMSLYGVVVPARNGIVAHSAEESIRNLGRVANDGMRLTDMVILDVMKGMADKSVAGQNI